MATRQFTIQVDDDWLDVLEELVAQAEYNSDTLTLWVLETDIFMQFKQQLNGNEVSNANPVCA